MSQTVNIYKSAAVHHFLRVRRGRKHGRPRGRGKVEWQVRVFTTFNPEAWDQAREQS